MGDPSLSPEALGKPSQEELEARWREVMDAVRESPRDPEVLIRAGLLADAMGRGMEAFAYLSKAAAIDPSKTPIVVPRLRRWASTPERQKDLQRLVLQPTRFGRALDGVFLYPLRGNGIGILILGALFVYGMRVLIAYNIFPLLSPFIMVVLTIYLTMYYVDVVTTTATGSEDLPEWPDPLRFRELFLDWTKIVMAWTVSFLPIILSAIFMSLPPASISPVDSDWLVPGPSGGSGPWRILMLAYCAVFGLLGLCYLPMAILANCVYGNPMACLNPAFILRSVGVAKGNYLVCVLAYFFVAAAAAVLESLAKVQGIFLFSAALATIIELYGGVIQMRILGVFYRMNRARLRWMA